MKVELINMSHNDNICRPIANFARVCTDRDRRITNIEQDFQLCKTLWKNGHHTPFEIIQFDFLISGVSRSLLAQITRYRHATFNVKSQRYCREDQAEFIMPEFDNLPKDKKEAAKSLFKDAMDGASSEYMNLISLGAKPEDARCVLPNATETRFRMVVNLRELIHIFDQRMDPHAQAEIRHLCFFMLSAITQCIAPSGISNPDSELIKFMMNSNKHKMKHLLERLIEGGDGAHALEDIIKEYEEFA